MDVKVTKEQNQHYQIVIEGALDAGGMNGSAIWPLSWMKMATQLQR